MKPLVSILIPAYNAEPWIGQTIRSAMAQTWPNKEIIVVDDGSTDGTLAVARQFASSGVTVATQKNSGAAAARNKAFSLSRGDFIQWLDADDLLAPGKVASQLENSPEAEKRILMSGPWAYFRHRPGHAVFESTPLWADLAPAEWLFRKLEFNLHMQTATWLVPRAITETVGPWNTNLLGDDDGEYFCRILMASNGTRFVPEAKVFYRRASRNLSFIGASRRKVEAQFASMRLHIDYLRSLEDSPRVRSACIKYLQRYMLYFYPEFPEIVRQAEELATVLGGRLEKPTLSWKYRWIQKIFGWKLGKRAWVALPNFKESSLQFWDRLLSRFESQPN